MSLSGRHGPGTRSRRFSQAEFAQRRLGLQEWGCWGAGLPAQRLLPHTSRSRALTQSNAHACTHARADAQSDPCVHTCTAQHGVCTHPHASAQTQSDTHACTHPHTRTCRVTHVCTPAQHSTESAHTPPHASAQTQSNTHWRTHTHLGRHPEHAHTRSHSSPRGS